MSKVAIQGNASGTGTFTIAAPNSNTDRTLTLPDEAGTVLTSASDITAQAMNGPAFSAYTSSQQTISTATITKILFSNEEYDTNNNFDSSRFTPTVAGYYFAQASAQVAATWTGGRVSIYKNGAEYKYSNNIDTSAGDTGTFSSSCLVYCNGSTDYIEAYVYLGNGQNLTASSVATWFQAHLVRAA